MERALKADPPGESGPLLFVAKCGRHLRGGQTCAGACDRRYSCLKGRTAGGEWWVLRAYT